MEKISATTKEMANFATQVSMNHSYLGNKVIETNKVLLFDYTHEMKEMLGIYIESTKESLIDETLDNYYLSNIFLHL